MIKKTSYALIFLLACLFIRIFTLRGLYSCAFLKYSNYIEVSDGVYFSKSFSKKEKLLLLRKIELSKERVSSYFGSYIGKSKIIIPRSTDRNLCTTNDSVGGSRNFTKYLLGTAYIVTTLESHTIDIISHEMVHAEIYHNLGYENIKKLPVWFNEGMASQVEIIRKDFKLWTAEDLSIYKNVKRDKVDIKSVWSTKGYSGKHGIEYYQLAYEEVKKWFKKTRITPGEFFKRIKETRSFKEAYKNYLDHAEK